MDNLWILTEERPKNTVIKEIINQYCKDFSDNVISRNELKILPLIKENKFFFKYLITGIKLKNIENIFIKTVSGDSSFLDFLVFKQEKEPEANNISEKPIMAIEETKTNDDESRNTGVYQRGSKFVFVENYYPNIKLYMLYNDELEARENKKPSDTSIFGTNILLTLGVKIIGKNTEKWFKRFNTLQDLIEYKSLMRKPPEGNVPIEIKKINENLLTISGRLSKPKDAGNIGHDPNIGALSMIAKCIRVLGWDKQIIITNHGVTQNYINKTQGKNKFLYICKLLNLKLDNINLPNIFVPLEYWHYEHSSEKVASILLHMIALYNNSHTIYENHAGCERGYFRDKEGKLITLPKKDKDGNNLLLPDCVIYDKNSETVLLIEGKKISTLYDGLEEIKGYSSIENEYIYKYYPNAVISRWVSIFGGNKETIPDEKVIFYVNSNGDCFINIKAPNFFINSYKKVITQNSFLKINMY
jgi:hypothetical protein